MKYNSNLQGKEAGLGCTSYCVVCKVLHKFLVGTS